jgi:hypothetical protein
VLQALFNGGRLKPLLYELVEVLGSMNFSSGVSREAMMATSKACSDFCHRSLWVT